MSGSNDNMTVADTVVSGLDGTDDSLTPFVWFCPDVDPHADIYFYRFYPDVVLANATYTARFTVGGNR